MKRIFLDWGRPCLVAAAAHLLDERGGEKGADLSDVMVVLPGGRAARRMLEVLVDLAEARGVALLPPEMIGPGRLDEVLTERPGRVAGELVCRLAWVRSLQGMGEGVMQAFVSEPPALDDLSGWSGLADLFDRLHRELAGGLLGFLDVVEAGARLANFDEAERWEAMAVAQEGYLDCLSAWGLSDPQAARAEAARAGAVRARGPIVLVGTADLNRAQRALLEQVGDQVTALVHAPEALADRFDAMGCLRVERWCEAAVAVRDEQIVAVDQPADQAAAVVGALGELAGAYAAEQITVGLPDSRLAPLVEQHLNDAGVPSRYAEGLAVSRTGPMRLLVAVADYLERKRYRDFAALLRHPDVESALGELIATDDAAGVGEAIEDWVTFLDRYYSDHLQAQMTGTWLGGDAYRAGLKRLHDGVGVLLGELAAGPRELGGWAQPICDLLLAVYGHRELARDDADDRVVVGAIDVIHGQLTELHGLDERVTDGVLATAAEAIRLIVGSVGEATVRPEPTDAAVELLGWLELPLDDAGAMVVTSFNDGLVPAALSADPFLPNALRIELGLTDHDRRCARDAYALGAILASREEVRLIVGRRSVTGDPLTPSRLLFACDDQTMAERVQRLIAGDPPARVARLPAGWEPAATTRLGPAPPRLVDRADLPNGLAVTGFRDYLACPYRFYLKYVLGLAALDDAAEELGPGPFGTLAHQVLGAFGRSELRDATDVDRIDRFLDEQLKEAAARQYGAEPLAAVRVQVEQLRRRLGAFAAWQAERAGQGWRIEYTEWGVSNEGAAIVVDGEPFYVRGRIDRIDVHAGDGRRAVIDYKTSERGQSPGKAHRSADGTWVDLQLPLYSVLLRCAGLGEASGLGYVVLPRDVSAVSAEWADWKAADLLEAEEAAAEVVRGIREGVFWPPADLD
ncbi:MAG: hypothetical protein CMJ49_14025, partial [Planctomycetaceae bacterium]|nr:hypothetical protein [Planctomycetaceae bacterium]